ncbi:MAG: type II toxin-antitoxin system HicB family antitoxin [Otoolea sp.]|nr:type II toxin-antitoxin system HicB family antitoxin [Clostridiaceae bacterium]MDD6074431.1 type II toxin-antitoxin system HicB family antitoxin [Clostridium sp.]MDY5484011.1 type II toxin-antitoxin system HicB family antitoxin [Clostridium sp.]
MTFVYPAVFTPKKDGTGYKAVFPDLECCEAEGPDLEDAVENARDAALNWILVELEDGMDLPAQTHMEDIVLEEGAVVKQIMVRVKLLPDND